MKSEIVYKNKNPKKGDLLADNNGSKVVLVTSEGGKDPYSFSGVVVYSQHLDEIGEHGQVWNKDAFSLFTGALKLST